MLDITTANKGSEFVKET